MTVSTGLDVPSDGRAVLDARARSMARRVQDTGVSGVEHVVVHVGPQRVATPADHIRHIADPRPITATPATSDAVVGVAAVLGQVVATIDLAAVLRVTPVRVGRLGTRAGRRHLCCVRHARCGRPSRHHHRRGAGP